MFCHQKAQYMFRIYGSIYHRIGHVFPDRRRRTNKVFTDIHLWYRKWNKQQNSLELWCKQKYFEQLQTMLHQYNPFAKCFKHATEIFSNQNKTMNMKLILKADTSKDPRRYNLPTVSELSVIIPGSSEYQPTNRDIVLYERAAHHPNCKKNPSYQWDKSTLRSITLCSFISLRWCRVDNWNSTQKHC